MPNGKKRGLWPALQREELVQKNLKLWEVGGPRTGRGCVGHSRGQGAGEGLSQAGTRSRRADHALSGHS